MPSLIFLIPVLSSTMVPVARTVVVILETFLLEIDLFVLEEKTLLLLARDADKDMDKTEEAILMYQFYLRCLCVLCVITMRKSFCARSKKKGWNWRHSPLPLPQKGKKKGENAEILSSPLGPKRRSFFPSLKKQEKLVLEKREKGPPAEKTKREGRKLFLKRIRYISSQITTLIIIIIIFSFSLSLPTKYILF